MLTLADRRKGKIFMTNLRTALILAVENGNENEVTELLKSSSKSTELICGCYWNYWNSADVL